MQVEAPLKQRTTDEAATVPVSVILRDLQNAVPGDWITLQWLTDHLGQRSFGLIILILALISVAPGVSFFSGLLLLVPAFQMMIGLTGPLFPHWLAARPIPSDRFTVVVRRALPVLKVAETVLRQRPPALTRAISVVFGAVVLILTLRLLLAPIPFSNILPALVICLLALAYLEQDGIVLCSAMLLGALIIVVDVDLLWRIIHSIAAIVLRGSST